ncbi:MAG: hypothetical protein LQ340_002881 [Diploschistes diacapsis]|nr:MAG: hypothetical protein LQ340_002881 [Diploschistes diacapsis]
MGLKLKLSGSGYLALNAVRVLNIIALLACIAASISMLVKTFIINGYFFFDSVSHVVTILMSAFLIISELPFFKSYFQNNWPLLSVQSGFVTLGVFMIIDGVMVLGNLNSNDENESTLGSSFFQIIVSGGIIAFVMGILNIVASYVFRDRKMGVTARMIRQYGATAAVKVANDVNYHKSINAGRVTRSSPSVRTVVSSAAASTDGLPLYNAPRRAPTVSSRYSQSTAAPEHQQEMMHEVKSSPEMEEPSINQHPAFQHAVDFV